jgi:membrane associated rhomboid family serine protease
MGASGAIYALLLAYAVIFPRSMIYIWGIIPVPSPLLVLIYGAISLFSQIMGGGGVAHLAHLMGFVLAWIYFLARMGINPVKVWKDAWKN